MRLAGKRALVTGAASGIGRASALRFAAEGASVVCVDLGAEVDATAEAIRAAGGRALALRADAGESAAVEDCAARCVREFGGLDVTFANAGISGGLVALPDITAAHFLEVLRVNLLGVFFAIQHSVPHMRRAGGGAIVCTASVAGLRANAGPIPYSASKAGVLSLVQTAAHALRGERIRINAICPGLIETGMTRPIFDFARQAGVEQRIGQLNPLGRAGAPEEIANMALFLASDESSYANGAAFVVDGGLASSHPFARR